MAAFRVFLSKTLLLLTFFPEYQNQLHVFTAQTKCGNSTHFVPIALEVWKFATLNFDFLYFQALSDSEMNTYASTILHNEELITALYQLFEEELQQEVIHVPVCIAQAQTHAHTCKEENMNIIIA